MKLTIVTEIENRAVPVVETPERFIDVEMEVEVGRVRCFFDSRKISRNVFMDLSFEGVWGEDLDSTYY